MSVLLNANSNLWERTRFEKSCPLLCDLHGGMIHNLHFRCLRTAAPMIRSQHFIIKMDYFFFFFKVSWGQKSMGGADMTVVHKQRAVPPLPAIRCGHVTCPANDMSAVAGRATWAWEHLSPRCLCLSAGPHNPESMGPYGGVRLSSRLGNPPRSYPDPQRTLHEQEIHL